MAGMPVWEGGEEKEDETGRRKGGRYRERGEKEVGIERGERG